MSLLGRLRSGDRTGPWKGGYAPYDLIRELTIAVAVVALLAIVLAVVFSSPDERPSTIAQWSRQMPVDFVTTATAELDGTSGTAEYGPPYNHNSGSLQHAAFFEPEKWLGVSHPIDTANDYVIDPLKTIPANPELSGALAVYEQASTKTRADWTEGFSKALEKGTVTSSGAVKVAPGEYGPVPRMMDSLLGLAQSGGLDGDLLTSSQFFQTDYTKPLLFMADGGLLEKRAEQQHLLGEQWGMMNETGSYPGQVWLWLYTLWYQVEPFKSSSNADLLVMLMMGLLSTAFVCVPFIPGVRSLPRRLPIYRLIWREHYRPMGSS
jgi:hypothetical protein